MTTPFNKIVNKKLLACTLNDVNIKEIKTWKIKKFTVEMHL